MKAVERCMEDSLKVQRTSKGKGVCLTGTLVKTTYYVERVHRGIGHSSNCGVCGHSFEDALHVLKDYPVARYIWNLFIPTEQLIKFYSNNTQD